MKKIIFSLAAILLLTSCSTNETAEKTTMTSTTTSATFETTTEATTTIITEFNSEINQILQQYLDKKSNYDDTKILIDDINSDGTDDIIYINDLSATFAYYHNAEIKEITAEQGWGDGLEGGGMPLYYNKNTDEFLTLSVSSSYKNYSFYEFSDGEYKLRNEHIWREVIDVWDIDKWIGNTNQQNLDQLLELYNLTFDDLKKLDEGELLGIAWTLGTFDRVNKYTIDEKEVTEAEWREQIDDFINDDETILLCPDNTDLDFVDVE